jgi:hypothetical protein
MRRTIVATVSTGRRLSSCGHLLANHTTMTKRIVLSFFSLCLLLSLGCGGNAKVTGKVTFPDGTPLTTGSVVFESDKLSASGKIQEDGSFRLGTDRENDGVPKGSYRVRIAGAVTYGEAPQTPENPYAPRSALVLPPSIPLIHRKYVNTETSGLTCDVMKSMTYDITVEKP